MKRTLQQDMDDRIDQKRERGTHIPLRCVNHPDLRWTTKNIGFVGARSILFAGDVNGGKPSMAVAPPERQLEKWMEDGFIRTLGDMWDFAAYVEHQLAGGYVFECDCPVSDLEAVLS